MNTAGGSISKHQTVRGALEKLLSEVELLMRASEDHRSTIDPILVPLPPQSMKDGVSAPCEPVSETIAGIMLATERVRGVRIGLQDMTARAHL
jgi:hypothetical protein